LLRWVIDECASASWNHGTSTLQWFSVPLDLTAKLVSVVATEPLGSNYFHLLWPPIRRRRKHMRVATDVRIIEQEHGSRTADLQHLKTCVTPLRGASPAPKVVRGAAIRAGEVMYVCVRDEMMMGAAISFAGNAIPLSHLQRDY